MRDRWMETAAERPQKQIGPAEQLLFACAAAQAGGRGRDAIGGALSDPGLDWPAAIQMSLQHGMAPLIARHLSDFGEDPRIPS